MSATPAGTSYSDPSNSKETPSISNPTACSSVSDIDAITEGTNTIKYGDQVKLVVMNPDLARDLNVDISFVENSEDLTDHNARLIGDVYDITITPDDLEERALRRRWAHPTSCR